MLATIMQALDTTIANVALPYMQGSLSATADQINWVLTSYIVAAAIATPVTGFLEARPGRKRLFLIAVAGFTARLGAVRHRHVACRDGGVPPDPGPVRRLAGAAVAKPCCSIPYPKEKHGSAMAMWGMGVMVGPDPGPDARAAG